MEVNYCCNLVALVKVKTPVEMITCGIEFFKYYDKSKILAYNIDEYLCPKQKNYKIAGNYYAKHFYYLELKLKRCGSSSQPNKDIKCSS